MLNLYIIGCGGVGGYLVDRLPMVLSSLGLDIMADCHKEEDQDDRLVEKYLTGAGNVAFPCVADRLVMVDGDTFNPRNAMRQGAGAGNKLVRRMSAMRKQIINISFLQRLHMIGFNRYINPGNMAEIIERAPVPNEENRKSREDLKGWRLADLDVPVVFLGVDNLKTRYEVSKYMESFDDCLVLNGGNEKTAGHVTVYERSGGKPLDPAIYEVFPNITPDADKRPDELECAVVAPKHDQIAITNSMVADVMLARFVKWARYGLDLVKGKGDKQRIIRHNEVLIDIEAPSMTPLYHPLA